MGINVSKGQRIDITKTNPGLNDVMVGLGWDVNDNGSSAFDLDALAFLLDANGKAKDEDVVYFNNLKHASGAVIHQGDNLTGEGDGDDEQIEIFLNKIPASIERIAICVAIYEADSRRQNFGMVQNAFVRLVDNSNLNEIIRYDLSEDYSIETAVFMGELYRHNGEWKFAAKGEGVQNGLQGLISRFN
jgi:tellurium resistance protein TerD